MEKISSLRMETRMALIFNDQSLKFGECIIQIKVKKKKNQITNKQIIYIYTNVLIWLNGLFNRAQSRFCITASVPHPVQSMILAI